MNNTSETQWDAMRRDRKYLPQTLTGSRDVAVAQLEAIIQAHFWSDKRAAWSTYAGKSSYAEAMTDQINVYVSGRKVAIYVP